jgi:hypothetical protein
MAMLKKIMHDCKLCTLLDQDSRSRQPGVHIKWLTGIAAAWATDLMAE